MKRRILSVLIAFALLCALLPQTILPASAAGLPDYSGSMWFFTTDRGVYNADADVTSAGGIAFICNGPSNLIPIGDTLMMSIPGEVEIQRGTYYYYDMDAEMFIQCSPEMLLYLECIAVPAFGGNLYFDPYMEAIVACDVSVTSAEIPEYVDWAPVSYIAEGAFEDCTELTEIVLPDSMLYIESDAFKNCTSLTTIQFGNGINTIGPNAFRNCTGLTELHLPDSLTSIGGGAFYGCSGLTEIMFPESLESIGSYAFWDTGIESATIPESVTFCGSSVFDYFHFHRVTVLSRNCDPCPPGLWQIDGSVTNSLLPVMLVYGHSGSRAEAFANENHFPFVSLEDDVPDYTIQFKANGGEGWMEDQQAYGGLPFMLNRNRFSNAGKPVFIGWNTEPDGTGTYYRDEQVALDLLDCGVLTLYAQWADEGGDTETVIPDRVTGVGAYAFYPFYRNTYYFDTLTEITIPESVTTIGKFAFSYLNNLASVTIPAGVTSIGDQAFSGIASSAEVTVLNPACEIFNHRQTLGDPNRTTIYGYTGSTAQAYAEQYGYTFVPLDEPTEYRVIFDANGGEGEMEDQVIPFDTYAYLTKNTFTRTGYGFAGWNTATDGSGTAVTNGKRVKNLTSGPAITLYAQWTPKTYTVKYAANYGTGVMENQSAVYDVPFPLSANAFTREGYAFAGWNTSSGGSGTAYSDGETVQNLASGGTKTLYAQWTPNGCEVAFDPNGGEGEMDGQAMTYNVYATLTPNGFTRTGFSFAGWNTAPDGSGTAYSNGMRVKNLATGGTVTLYAQWKPNAYSIKFHANYGSGTMISQPMTYGVSEALTPNAFTRTGYAFSGWNTAADGSGTAYSDGETVQNLATGGSKTLYAQWTPNGYEVVFDANGGAGSMENQPMTYGVSAVLDRNAFTRTGYSFVNWNTAADGSGTAYANGKTVKNLATGGAVTLYARWKPNNYTIKFYSNGGAGTMATLKATYDLPIELTANAFTRVGYTFSGWGTAADGSGTPYFDRQLVSDLAVSGTFALYAQWTPNSYEVVFDANGGEGSMENQTMTCGEYAALTENAFTRTGYAFNGWNTAADGSGTSYANGKSVKNLAAGGTVTLYAKWRPNTYSVKFYSNGGTGTMAIQRLTYDAPAALTGNAFTRAGYSFAGWNTAKDGSGTAYADAQQVENLALSGTVALYAQWTKN